VNIEELPLKGVTEFVLNKVTNIPGVTTPDTDTLIVFADIVITVPEDRSLFKITKFGFTVYAELVYSVDPVKNPLGAAELNMSSTKDASYGIPYVDPEFASTKIGYFMFILLNSGTGVRFCELYCGLKTLNEFITFSPLKL